MSKNIKIEIDETFRLSHEQNETILSYIKVKTLQTKISRFLLRAEVNIGPSIDSALIEYNKYIVTDDLKQRANSNKALAEVYAQNWQFLFAGFYYDQALDIYLHEYMPVGEAKSKSNFEIEATNEAIEKLEHLKINREISNDIITNGCLESLVEKLKSINIEFNYYINLNLNQLNFAKYNCDILSTISHLKLLCLIDTQHINKYLLDFATIYSKLGYVELAEEVYEYCTQLSEIYNDYDPSLNIKYALFLIENKNALTSGENPLYKPNEIFEKIKNKLKLISNHTDKDLIEFSPLDFQFTQRELVENLGKNKIFTNPAKFILNLILKNYPEYKNIYDDTDKSDLAGDSDIEIEN